MNLCSTWHNHVIFRIQSSTQTRHSHTLTSLTPTRHLCSLFAALVCYSSLFFSPLSPHCRVGVHLALPDLEWGVAFVVSFLSGFSLLILVFSGVIWNLVVVILVFLLANVRFFIFIFMRLVYALSILFLVGWFSIICAFWKTGHVCCCLVCKWFWFQCATSILAFGFYWVCSLDPGFVAVFFVFVWLSILSWLIH